METGMMTEQHFYPAGLSLFPTNYWFEDDLLILAAHQNVRPGVLRLTKEHH